MPYWRLVRRVAIVDDNPLLWLAVVGSENIAIGVQHSHGREFRAVLDSEHFAMVWEGNVKGAIPFQWSDRSLVLKMRDWKDTGVWSCDSGKVVWRGHGQSCIAGDVVAICAAGGTIAMRCIATGEVARTLTTDY